MHKYNHFISIGYVCDAVGLMSSKQTAAKREEAYAFDRIATPMWAVTELFQNGFEQFLEPSNATSGKLFEHDDTEIVFDERYYIRYPINKPHIHRVATLSEVFNKRKDRMIQLLSKAENNGEPVLFIRTEERASYPDRGRRLIFDEYVEKYSKPESYYLQVFDGVIKNLYPALKYKILYFNDAGVQEIGENIVTLPASKKDYRSFEVGAELSSIIKEHSQYLENKMSDI